MCPRVGTLSHGEHWVDPGQDRIMAEIVRRADESIYCCLKIAPEADGYCSQLLLADLPLQLRLWSIIKRRHWRYCGRKESNDSSSDTSDLVKFGSIRESRRTPASFRMTTVVD